MSFLGRLFGRDQEEFVAKGPFTAQMIFECERVLQNKQKVTHAIEEFAERFPENILAEPRITQASDGNVIELTLSCADKEELLNMNKELELIAERYGLR